MTRAAVVERPRPRSLRSGAFFVAAGAALLLALPAVPVVRAGASAAAQEPDSVRPTPVVPAAPDTLPRPLAGDSLLQDTVPEDTLGPPPPELPPLDPLGPASFARGVWEWDRAALRRLPILSLLGLLERIPGIVPVRVDLVNQPEGAAWFGATAGGIRYEVDGFEIDPLVTPTLDPARLPLLALESVRVERRLGGATVRLRTVAPDHPRPRSVIEAGTGDYDITLFRGVFLAPGVLGGPLALGFERLGGDGFLAGGNSNHLAGWVKWSWIRDGSGVQVEYRQSDMDRAGLGEGLLGARRDWVVRARTSRGPVTGEVYAGASSVEDDLADRVLRERTPQGGVRLRADLEGPVPLEARVAARFRGHPRLPAQALEVGVRAVPLPYLAVEGEAVQGWWREGEGTGGWTVRAQAGPLFGVTLFGEYAGGDPLLGGGPGLRLPAAADSLSLEATRSGARAGAELAWRGLVLGGAMLRGESDPVSALGIRPEGSFVLRPGREVTGFEAVARIPTGWDPMWLEGWYVNADAEDRLYVPEHLWRAGLVYHHQPLPSGNLELYVRLEHVFRGSMMAAVPDTVAEEGVSAALSALRFDGTPRGEVGPVTAYRATNLELMIRVVSLRGFVRWENIRHRLFQSDLPGFPLPGQRIMYGVKWDFLN